MLARRKGAEDATLGSKARVAEMSSAWRLAGRRAPLDAARLGGAGAASANPLLSPWLRRSQGLGGAPRRLQLALPALPHTAHSLERPSLQVEEGAGDGGAEEDLDHHFWQQQQQQQEDAWGSVNPLHRQPRAQRHHSRPELKQPPSRFSRQYHSPERDVPPRRGGHWEATTAQRSLAGSEERRAAGVVAAQQGSGWQQRAAQEQREWGEEEGGREPGGAAEGGAAGAASSAQPSAALGLPPSRGGAYQQQ